MHPNSVPAVAVTDLPDDALLLDVREDEEWAAGHIDGARHVPMHRVPQHVQYGELPSDEPIVVVCKAGGRSAQVTAWLRQQGYEAINLDGGMLEWAAQARPMIAENGGEPYVA